MANMSYCRFYNTRDDLEECLDAIREEKRISEEEARAGRWMFDDFLDFCRENGIIDSYDAEAVRDLFDSLKEKNDE